MSDFDKILSNLSNEQKQKLVSLLQESVKENSTTQPPQQNKPPKVDEDFRVSKSDSTNYRRKEPVRARENQWRDEGEFKDVETPDYEKTPRRRQPPKKVNVECSVCGKSFKADSRFIYGEYHRCNRCTGR
jgi:hypothetical protein